LSVTHIYFVHHQKQKIMNTLISYFQNQLKEEAITARKMLERVPADKLDWQPHPRSMSLVRLATHVAEIPNWIPLVTEKDELDFGNGGYSPHPINSNKDLMDYFEKNVRDGKAALERASDDILDKPWVMRSGEEIYITSTKGEVLRMALSQIIHHRAQLGVYLRLLDIPIPGSYGPSADEN
jgi:uncharacterized damage-inducible protein DinB